MENSAGNHNGELKPVFMVLLKPVFIALLLLVPAGCSNLDRHGGMATGAGLGAGIGAAIGSLACKGDPKCIAIGAAAGAVAGMGLGYLWDRRQAELRRIAERQRLDVAIRPVRTYNAKEKTNGVEIAIHERGMFDPGSAKLNPSARRKLTALASAYRDSPQRLLVIGHTDATGPEQANLKLSERRARTVARLLAGQGIPTGRIFYQGAGESRPIASNDTPAGRARNRRVEIVELDSTESIAAYSLQRKSDSRYLAHSNRTAREKAGIRSKMKTTGKASRDSKPSGKAADSARSARIPGGGRHGRKPPVDFGGVPARRDITPILAALGGPRRESGGFGSIVSTAHASEFPVELTPCYLDNPRVTGAVRNLQSGAVLDPSAYGQSDYFPGLNGYPFLARVNGHLLAIKGLRVLEHSAEIAGAPQLLIYRDYDSRHAQNADFRLPISLETYRGRGGLLLRGYFKTRSPVECMDMVVARRRIRAKAGILYYDAGTGLYEKEVLFRRMTR